MRPQKAIWEQKPLGSGAESKIEAAHGLNPKLTITATIPLTKDWIFDTYEYTEFLEHLQSAFEFLKADYDEHGKRKKEAWE